MEEINKKTLIEALSSLKEYSPPDGVWEHIDMELELGSNDVVSKQMLAELPEHEPPAKVWDQILQNLEGGSRPGKIIPLNWRRVAPGNALNSQVHAHPAKRAAKKKR